MEELKQSIITEWKTYRNQGQRHGFEGGGVQFLAREQIF